MRKSRVLLFSCAFLIPAFLALQLSSRALSEKTSPKKKNKETSFVHSLQSGKTVVLYFYSSAIPESSESIRKVKKIVGENPRKTALFTIEAEKNHEMIDSYGVEYAPSVFVLRPGEGVVRSFEVDIDLDLMKKIIHQKEPRLPGVEAIASGIAARQPSLVFFMADWCHYCQMLIPEINRFKSKHGRRINVRSINVDKNRQISDQYLITGVPQIVLLDPAGLIIDRLSFPSGAEDYLKAFKKSGIRLRN